MRVLAAALVILHAVPVSASLGDDVARLREGWGAVGAHVAHLGTQFVYRGAALDLELPVGSPRCQSIAVLSERHIRFELMVFDPSRPVPAAEEQGGEDGSVEREPSRAGMAVVELCGELRKRLRRVRVVMYSERAAVELLVVRHHDPLPDPSLIVPSRAAGAETPHEVLPRPVITEPLGRRVARTIEDARLDGARAIVPLETTANTAGKGVVGIHFPAGCHRVTVLGSASTQAPSPVDIDAELRHPGATHAFRLDRSFAPDARLDFCLGEPGSLQVRYLGARPLAPVAVVDAHWPLPDVLRGLADARLREVLAWGLFRRPTPTPTSPPIQSLRGGAGVTVVPLANLEPGCCYLAMAGTGQGAVAAARLSVTAGGRASRDQSTEPPHALVVTFCTGPAPSATLQVEVRSAFSWWTLLLYRLPGGPS